MVDALREAHSALTATGILVDLRPLSCSNAPLEIVTPDGATRVGAVDASATLDDDLASDRAVTKAVENGWFTPCRKLRFEFEFSWDTVSEMASFMEERRTKRVTPPYSELERIHRRWRARTTGKVRLRYWRTMLLAVYQKALPHQRE